jgi:hypothetical protein
MATNNRLAKRMLAALSVTMAATFKAPTLSIMVLKKSATPLKG